MTKQTSDVQHISREDVVKAVAKNFDCSYSEAQEKVYRLFKNYYPKHGLEVAAKHLIKDGKV